MNENLTLVPLRYVKLLLNCLIDDSRLLKQGKKNKDFGTEIDTALEGILNDTIYMEKKEFKRIKKEQEILEKL